MSEFMEDYKPMPNPIARVEAEDAKAGELASMAREAVLLDSPLKWRGKPVVKPNHNRFILAHRAGAPTMPGVLSDPSFNDPDLLALTLFVYLEDFAKVRDAVLTPHAQGYYHVDFRKITDAVFAWIERENLEPGDIAEGGAVVELILSQVLASTAEVLPDKIGLKEHGGN